MRRMPVQSVKLGHIVSSEFIVCVSCYLHHFGHSLHQKISLYHKRVKMLRRTPVIVILGSTATGKTKLSIELANRFNGEIISADSMQIYKGLDISTAKATQNERSKAVHHMLDVCDMKTKTFTVVDFRDLALPKIQQLLENDKKPIIVGGTNYYIETLLWKVLISSHDRQKSNSNCSETTYHSISLEKIFETFNIDKSTQQHESNPICLHNLLKKIDPTTADSLHPNNVRKIRRAIEVYIESGRPMSDILMEQKSQTGSSYLGGPMRFEHIIFLWLKSDQEKLNARIDKRIDSMIDDGVLFEIRECYKLLKMYGIDSTRGIMQAIGFKEFLPYLEQYPDERYDMEITEYIRKNGGLSGQRKFLINKQYAAALKLLEQCLNDLCLHTKQFSKRQIKWIRNRLVSTKGRFVPSVYELDSTMAETNWHNDVFSKAEHIIQSYIDNVEPNVQPAQRMEHPTNNLNMHVTHQCDVCDRCFVGDLDFNAHINSNTHRQAVNRQRKHAMTKMNKRFILTQIIEGIWNYWNRTKNRIISFFWQNKNR